LLARSVHGRNPQAERRIGNTLFLVARKPEGKPRNSLAASPFDADDDTGPLADLDRSPGTPS
jgi:hypothetical protein